MIDVKECLNDVTEKMDMAIMFLDEQLSHIRAGKANVKILDGIRVDSYGQMVPLNGVASVTTPDARTIAIKPWDKSMFKVIEKAILDSEVGITPEERRKLLAKQCAKEAETAKISVRNARRDGVDKLKKGLKDGLAEDVEKDAEGDLQKIHDKFIKKIDDMLAEKNKEIMTV